MEPREIPGFYFDPQKKKYFKIQQNVPASSAHSAESVKRRKLEHEKARRAQVAAAQKVKLVKRSEVLQHPLLGGFLDIELGIPRKDLQVDCWAGSLNYKGFVSLDEHRQTGQSRDGQLAHPPLPLQHIYIENSDEQSGLGLAFGSWAVGGDNQRVNGTLIPRNEHDIIVWEPTTPFGDQRPYIQAVIPQLSSMTYHKPSCRLLLTSRDTGAGGGIYSVSSQSNPYDPSLPAWNLYRSRKRHLYRFPGGGQPSGRSINTCTPAPAASSNIICAVGTSQGLGYLSSEGHMVWSEDQSSARGDTISDVLSVDFFPHNPQAVVAGIRGSRKICIADLRQRSTEWEWVVHRSSPAHVRCLSEHHVLAAGPNHSMSIYDLRFRHRDKSRNMPIVTFPEFKNAERIHFGFDVDTKLGIVATSTSSQDANSRTTDVFSLKTGRKLRVPALDKENELGHGGLGLMFQTLPREENASLFVSGEQVIYKYSLTGAIDEWTGEVFEPRCER